MTENDPLFPEDIQQSGIKQLQVRKIKYETETYRGVKHGKLMQLILATTLKSSRVRSGRRVRR